MITSLPIPPIKKATRYAIRIRTAKGYDQSKTYGRGIVQKDRVSAWIRNIETESKMKKSNDYEDCIKQCLKGKFGLSI